MVVGAGAVVVVGGNGGSGNRTEPAAMNLMVGSAVAERGDVVRSATNVTIIAMPSMATANSLGSATNRPTFIPCM